VHHGHHVISLDPIVPSSLNKRLSCSLRLPHKTAQCIIFLECIKGIEDVLCCCFDRDVHNLKNFLVFSRLFLFTQ